MSSNSSQANSISFSGDDSDNGFTIKQKSSKSKSKVNPLLLRNSSSESKVNPLLLKNYSSSKRKKEILQQKKRLGY